MSVNRRVFLAGLGALTGHSAIAPQLVAQGNEAQPAPPDWLPLQDPALVQEVVARSHADVDRVRALIERQPALANAAIDWGFGDWESALGAAAHMGRRDIAELLLAHGARPTIFSAAMLGHLEVVKAFVASSPGVQRTLGPHGITLLAHARAGGAPAVAVADYLDSLGDADRRPPTAPLDPADRDSVVGDYLFGPGPTEHFTIDLQNNQLGIGRPGYTRRFLLHAGSLVFFPSGVPSVRVAFTRMGDRASQLTISAPEVIVTAKRRT